jgi:DNA-binding CsgD family transcriptional regulator
MFVGREAECAQIAELLASARAGSGGALVVCGEPGIGKSTLLEFAAGEATAMRVLRSRAVETEAELTFAGLHELLRPILHLLPELPERQAAALNGAFGLGPPLDARLLIGAGTLSLLAAAAEEQPLLCLVDDAQWLDTASADALAFAARRIEADAMVLLFAMRDSEPKSFEPVGIPTLTLGGLEREEAAVLLHGSGLSDAVVSQLYEAAEGNALALLELPGALSPKQRAGEEPLPEPLPATKAIQAAYAARIEALPEQTRRALVVASAEPSGELAAIEAACAALDVDPSALATAEDADLVALAHGRVAFHHPLVAAAAYHGGRPAERRAVHAALADAVPAEDRARQVWHLAEAAARPDEHVAAALVEGARASYARSGYRSAAVILERAAALTPETSLRAERLYLAAIMHFYRHDITRALSLLDEAERLSPDGDRGPFRLLRLALEYYRGVGRAATLLLEEAESRAGDPRGAALAAALASFFRATVRDGAGALEAAQRTREYANSNGGAGRDAVAELGAGVGFIAAGRPGEAGPVLELAVDVLKTREWRYEHPEDWLQGYSGAYAGGILLVLGEHDVLRDRIEALQADLLPGDEVSYMLTRGLLGTADYLGGRWQEARAGIGESLRIADEIRWLGPQAYAAARVLAQLAAAQGSEDEVSTYEAVAAPYATVAWASYVGAGAPGLLALGRGDFATAIDCYETHVLPQVGRLHLYHDVADAIEAFVRAGRAADASPWLETFVEQARESGWPWALARAAHLEALIAEESYEEPFELALEWQERARQPFLRARTALAYGERLRRDGLRRRAREQLRPALHTLDSLGAVPWAEQAATALRATGEQVRRRHDLGTSQLTPQELQVALVVAGGATNKEAAAQLFLSPKTIEKHLGSVYAKLGLRSRSELARVFVERDLEAVAGAAT